jgi:hypothetical protein
MAGIMIGVATTTNLVLPDELVPGGPVWPQLHGQCPCTIRSALTLREMGPS